MDVVFGGKVAVAGHRILGPRRILIVNDELAIASEKKVLAVEGVVDTSIERVSVLRNGILKLIVGAAIPASGCPLVCYLARNVRVRENGNQLGCSRVDTSGGDQIAGSYTTGLPGHGGIGQRLAQLREVSGFHQRRGHHGLDGGGPTAGEELEVSEKESLVFPNWATDGGAILI